MKKLLTTNPASSQTCTCIVPEAARSSKSRRISTRKRPLLRLWTARTALLFAVAVGSVASAPSKGLFEIGTGPLVMATVANGRLQADTLGTQKQKPVAVDLADSKVTVGDVNAVFGKLDHAVRKVVGISGKPRLKLGGRQSASATREQIVLEFARLFEMARPHFKFTPRKIKFDPSMLTIRKGTRARAELETMIALQFVAKVGPLAASEKPTLTLAQFGDAVGYFYARVADLTHTPSSKWSPYMNQGPQAPAPGGTAKSRTSDKTR